VTNVDQDKFSASRRARYQAFARARRALFVTIAALGLVVVSVVAVGAVNVLSSPTSSTLHGATSLGRWVVPHDQDGAPVVPGAGGVSGGGFIGVSCPSVNGCVAVGSDGAQGGVASTSQNDGGTWSQGALASGEPVLDAVDCASTSLCVAVGQGASARSTNGGTTWTSTSVPTSNTTLLGVDCPSATLCVSVGVSPDTAGPYAGQLLVSSDGGTTWTVPSLPASLGALGSVDCPTSTFCVSVGASILVSTNAGTTWSLRTVNGGTGVLRSVSCASATTCVAIGANPAIAQSSNAAAFEVVTTDGGTTWTSVVMPPGSATLSQLSCSSTACEAVGSAYNGAAAPVLATKDGGARWTVDSSIGSSLTGINALSCNTGTNCVFVGEEGQSPVSVSTVNGVASVNRTIGALVRSPKDVAR
jgi:photosystem II stability/assembly factor-like uncharacterized protein